MRSARYLDDHQRKRRAADRFFSPSTRLATLGEQLRARQTVATHDLLTRAPSSKLSETIAGLLPSCPSAPASRASEDFEPTRRSRPFDTSLRSEIDTCRCLETPDYRAAAHAEKGAVSTSLTKSMGSPSSAPTPPVGRAKPVQIRHLSTLYGWKSRRTRVDEPASRDLDVSRGAPIAPGLLFAARRF
jgi:hypothetical protein